MKKLHLLTRFDRYNNAALEQKAEVIANGLTDNAYFPDPEPGVNELKKVIAAFDEAIVKADDGGKVEREIRDKKREELIGMLNKLSHYVEYKADGDGEKLASSGFSVSNAHGTPIGILPKPENFKAIAENKGMIKLKLKAIHGAHIYHYEYKKTTAEEWITIEHSKSNLLITDLESGQEYEFRVAGVGSAEEHVYSDTIRSFVL